MKPNTTKTKQPRQTKQQREQREHAKQLDSARQALAVFDKLERRGCTAVEWLMLKLGCSSNEASELAGEIRGERK